MENSGRTQLQSGIAFGRSRMLVGLAAFAVIATNGAIAVVAATREPLDAAVLPVALAVAVLALAAFLRPVEPAPGEKFTLSASAVFFGAMVLPAASSVGAAAGAAFVAKAIQRRSRLNTAVNVAQVAGAAGMAELARSAWPEAALAGVLAAGVAYAAATLVSVGAMVVASQGPSAARSFLGREWLPTSALVAVGAVAALLWTAEPLTILLFLPVLATIEIAARRAARERATVAGAERAAASGRDLVQDAAHELRTPLAALVGDLDYVSGSGLAPDERSALEAARMSARRLASLAERMLLLARTEASVPEPVPVDLAEVVTWVAREVRPREGVDLECDIAPGVVVRVPADLAAVIVSDILGNAAAYTTEGSIRIGVDREGPSAVLIVADTGIGIPKEELPRVFDRFFRGRRASAMAGGTGLGLAIVRHIVERYGGELTIDSVAGRGTSVRVRFPLAA